MTTDTIDLKPLAQHHQKRVRDRPARLLIKTGLALAAVGAVDWTAIVLITEPEDIAGWREVKPLGTVAMMLGGLAIVAGILVRIFQHIQDQGRERSKRDMQKVLAEAEIGRLRREHQLRADLEMRYDQIDGWVTRIGRFVAEHAKLAERLGATEENLCALRDRVETAIVKAAAAPADERTETGQNSKPINGAKRDEIDAELRGFLAAQLHRDEPPEREP